MSSAPVKTPEQLSKEAADRIALASAAANEQVAQGAAAAQAQAPLISIDDVARMEETIRSIIAKQAAEKVAVKPKEPNWATVTEEDALAPNSAMYIPVIEHEIPSYLEVKLADPEYLPVWVNQNIIRVSQKKAEGYELLKPEHIAKDFVPPLQFDSEGLYRYQDVICMRGHKRIVLGMRRKYVDMSTGVLKGAKAVERARKNLEDSIIANDSALDSAFGKGSMSFY